jgi:hypothetical protein
VARGPLVTHKIIALDVLITCLKILCSTLSNRSCLSDPGLKSLRTGMLGVRGGATSRKVAGSIPEGVIGFFIDLILWPLSRLSR